MGGQASCCEENEPENAEVVTAKHHHGSPGDEVTLPTAKTSPAAEERMQGLNGLKAKLSTEHPCFSDAGESEEAGPVPAPAPDLPKEAPATDARKDDALPKVVACFRTEDGHEIDVIFKKRPWGIDFGKNAPLKVKRVHPNSVGEELGVKGGMSLIKIDGVVLPNDAVGAMEEIKKAAVKLA
eukprot:TRINITY_DN13320_c0_g2_i1.p1 TRINITY_DN13320_c0_g2~~TRINITY_DN13320_c0_g2_i1.p1  ORF type:complete len:182 (-),score=38.38 TRINITY_DN13320_c0_g2_i1:162-707(-)